MNWYEILVGITGVIGGGAGLISIYHAKSNKQTIDISNMQSMLEEAHKMFDEMKQEKDNVSQDFQEYKELTNKYVADFKERFAKLEERVDRAENNVLNLKRSVFQGYRCKFPDDIQDCPVIKEYERIKCIECKKDDNCICDL